jgi:hypothetical protein
MFQKPADRQLWERYVQPMTDILIYIADRLKGKSLFPFFRTLLNIIFSVSIADSIFSKTHPDITLPSTLDYQKIWTFFIQGHFAIPLIIFLLVYLGTQGFTTLFFMYFGDYHNFKLTKKILAYKIEKNEVHEGIEGISEVSNKFPIVDITKEKLLEMYNKLKVVYDKKKLIKLEAFLEEGKTTITDNFTTVLRGLIATTIYFATIPSFGWLLFTIVVLLFIFLFVILLLGYKLLDIIPALMSKAIQAETLYKDNE